MLPGASDVYYFHCKLRASSLHSNAVMRGECVLILLCVNTGGLFGGAWGCDYAPVVRASGLSDLLHRHIPASR